MSFGMRFKDALTISAANYADAVEKALSQIPHVDRSSITSTFDKKPSQADLVIESEPIALNDGGHGFPLPNGFFLSFELSLPTRIQEDLTRHLWHECEVPQPLRIDFLRSFYGPLVVVRLPENTDHAKPSDAIVLVREYLRRELERSASDVYLETRGPSPFHADFFLRPANTEESKALNSDGFNVLLSPHFGYDDLWFVFDSRRFSSDGKAFAQLVNNLVLEFDAYYEVSRLRADELTDWPEIEELYDQLDQISESRKLIHRIRYFSRKGNLIYRVIHELSRFKASQIGHDAAIKSLYTHIYERGLPTYLARFFDRVRADRSTFPVDEYLAFAQFLEHRRLKAWEVSILALAALVGALLGGVVTMLASAPGSSPTTRPSTTAAPVDSNAQIVPTTPDQRRASTKATALPTSKSDAGKAGK
jgi:hypothetical protein